jgi:hypothetical protein
MNSGVVIGGARLVWRRQSVVWWIFLVNLILAVMGTLPVASNTAAVLDHSLAAGRLVHGFDLAVLFNLMAQPSHPLSDVAPSISSVAIFFLFMLFIEGGVLELYRLDRKLTRAEFFGACGTYFWRFARLVIYSLILIVPIFLLASFVVGRSDRLASDATHPMLGFWFEVGGLLVVLLLLLTVRLWFDLAQVDAVREGERAMRRSLRRALGVMRSHFWSLFWMFLRIHLVGWMALAAAVLIWVRLVRPESIRASFFVSQAALLLWLGARLWQRASETIWYQRHFTYPVSAPSEPQFSPSQPIALEPAAPEPTLDG